MFGLSPSMQGFLGGAAAVSIPLLFNLIKEIVFDWRKRNAERVYISVQLVFLLDKFVAHCADVAWDRGCDPTMPEPDDEALEDQIEIPIFDMSSAKGEHKYLEPEMIARLHTIEIRLNQSKEVLCNEGADWNWGGYNWKYYETRRELLGQIGLYATAIAKDLRIKFKIQNIEGWEPSERIHRSIQDLKEIKAKRRERQQRRKAEQERREVERHNV
ncbi:hypothetical protein ACSMDC_09840 [Yersinia enterocolitica]|uniref:hypothetical protein n=1 Tax=Yersinia enterocolitica TaxID=630 RepID=UPI003F528523